jgi:hypothetical protein
VLSSEPVEASPAAKQKLMERVQAGAPVAKIPAYKPGFWARLRESLSSPNRLRLEPLVVTASLIVALVSLGSVFLIGREISRLRQEIGELQASVLNQEQIILYLSNPGSQSIVIAGTEHSPEAQGRVIFAPEDTEGGLLITGLAPLEPDQVYQLWLIEGETPQSAGTFDVDANGQAVVQIAAPTAIADFDALGVSVEPAGGSSQPTGDIVLLGPLTNDA